jgi:protein TonB
MSAARRTRLAGGALLLHLGAAAIYLFATLWTIRPVTAPKLLEAFVLAPAPPQVLFVPAPVSPPRRDPARPPAGSPAGPVAAPVSQPTAVPDLAPATAIDPLPAVVSGDGAPDTVLPGYGEALPTSGRGDGAAIVYHAGMTAPRILHRTEPLYPETARRAKRQGVVVLEAEIGRDGLLRSARAVNPPLGFGLEDAALDALRSWRFTPARLNGEPVAVLYRLQVRFQLH